MKQFLLLSIVFTSFVLRAQTWAFATLDINQVKARVNSNGDLFWNYANAAFEIPKDSGAHTIFAAAAWMGGLDSNGALHIAAQTYRQTGNDFYPGPIMDSIAYSASSDAQWNQVWKINKTTIDSFLLWRSGVITTYTIPAAIYNWPGNGSVQMGMAPQLAPYIDADNDGSYNPYLGDYPCIKGDQAIFIMFNDDRSAHGETGGAKLKTEVHAMIYAYNAPGTWLDTTVFVNYKVYNRSSNTYTNVFWGQWTDFDIGDFADDYIGCDVQRHIAYGYNGDMNDGPSALPVSGSYGANPPAQGVVFLKGPEADSADGSDNNHNGITDEAGESCRMSYFVYYHNDFSITGNPEYDDDYYGYLHGEWKDSSAWTYGGTGYGGVTQCSYMFPGSTDALGWGTGFVPQTPWDEVSSGNLPDDRRGMASSGPFTFEQGSSECIDFAYVFGRGNNGPLSGVAAMQHAADSAYNFYLSNNPCSCDENPLGIQSHQSTVAGIYPNPASSTVNIICGDNATGATIEILDVNGKVVKTSTVLSGNSSMINVEDLAAGLYFVRVNKGSVVLTGKFIRN